MNRRHLRRENRVLLPHLLRERDDRLSVRLDLALRLLLLTDADGGEQGADPDARGTEVADLIDLEAGVDLAGAGEDLLHLVGRHGVKTAAEGIQLDDVEVVRLLHVVCGRVQSRVEHPLVVDTDRALKISELRDRVLGEDSHAVGVDELRDAVVDLRVDVVRSARENNAVAAGLLEIFQCLDSLGLDIASVLRLLFPRRVRRILHLDLRDVMEDFDEAVCHDLLAGEREERVHEADRRVTELLDVVLDILRVGRHDRAVVVIDCAREFISLERNARVENELHALADQPLNMAVRELGRIALRLRRNRLDAELVELMRR